MKLLIVTQSIDVNNPILGFFHRWVEEFSKHFESIVVICLEKGAYDLPSNVKVLSLGKEKLKIENWHLKIFQKIKYTLIFWKYIWKERKNYDAVFVHMNEEYVLLGGLFWTLIGKKITMWRNHHAGTFRTDIACYICDKIFCTSKYSYTAKFKKTVLMPVGIDISFFKPDENIKRVPNSILFLGRISSVKKVHVLIEALKFLKDRGIEFNVSLYGDALTKDEKYYNQLVKKVNDYHLESFIKFYKAIPNYQTPTVYNAHEIFVNLSSSGMYDKTIFEAMACGCIVLASNNNLRGEIDSKFIFDIGNKHELEQKLLMLLSASSEEVESDRIKLRTFADKHSLKLLASKLVSEITL